MSKEMSEDKVLVVGFTTIFAIIVVVIISIMYFYPKYKVYSREQTGKAELAQAEYNRQIKTLEAEQKMESAKFEAQAEIIRAKGVAEANKIIADGLGGSEGYLRYLWIDRLGETDNIIYVPTEAGLPILEAGKRGDK